MIAYVIGFDKIYKWFMKKYGLTITIPLNPNSANQTINKNE